MKHSENGMCPPGKRNTCWWCQQHLKGMAEARRLAQAALPKKREVKK